ncbi:DNA-binding transcriptional regulator, LacI/PurR family [Brevibacterium sp. 239c]|uniref:LacI family DNA-binding transcriptional regulator n=1 Tax=Brevibacterium sp. 239c TaxID=1965356 RepID=UPI000C679F6E|nr:LacI family DNA-binding transcriptional regulator [Brevibacterium sp. 239c]SMX72127.1 DNA-binding transcriptional regulator, LacI/PurR family [Brevibacterium sp. 239c]
MTTSRPVTLQQVADQAQVSRSAASFALSGRPGVSEATRSKVLSIAAELGYSPNRTAQNLRSSRTGIVAVYSPKDVSALSYYMEATFGIVDEAEASGHTVTIVPHTATAAEHLRADGIIVLDPTLGDPIVPRLLELGLPVISGEQMPQKLSSPMPPATTKVAGTPEMVSTPAVVGTSAVAGTVTSDHIASTREVLDAFAAAGARAPAIIAPEERMSWSMAVEDAYQQWCAENEVEARVETASLEGMAEATRQATKRLLDSGDVDAILALTDGSVLTVLTSAANHGRRLGADLLVAAAVDSPVLGYMDPPVTAVDLRPREFGRACMNLLSKALETSGPPADSSHSLDSPREVQLAEVVDTKVIHRASTAGPLHLKGH